MEGLAQVASNYVTNVQSLNVFICRSGGGGGGVFKQDFNLIKSLSLLGRF